MRERRFDLVKYELNEIGSILLGEADFFVESFYDIRFGHRHDLLSSVKITGLLRLSEFDCF